MPNSDTAKPDDSEAILEPEAQSLQTQFITYVHQIPFLKPLFLILVLLLLALVATVYKHPTTSNFNLFRTTQPQKQQQPKLKNYISYSLFSKDGKSIPEAKYTNGIWNNIKLAQEVYPDWTVLIHIPETLNKPFVSLLREAPNVEIVEMPFRLEDARIWRFLVSDYENVDRFVVRNADAGIQWREKRAVDDWIASGTEMHVMRDGVCQHDQPMWSGTWGARAGFTKRSLLNQTMKEIIAEFKPNSTLNEDRKMLTQVIWPALKENAVCHDAEPGKMDFERPHATFPFPGGNFDRFPSYSTNCNDEYHVGNPFRQNGKRTFDCSAGPQVPCKQHVFRSFQHKYMIATGVQVLDLDAMKSLEKMIDLTV